MEQKWELSEEASREQIEKLAQEAQVPPLIARVLHNRGVVTAEAAQAFFNPSIASLHDPFLMKDMDRAAERILKALREKEPITLYGDYDVGGITAVSMLYLFFRDLGGNVHAYIPDRQAEGYGLSEQGIREAATRGAGLILSVDCGITSPGEARLAQQLGLDLIISDHHEPTEHLPDALAVLDPKRPDCAYPFKDLAGVGVAFKIAQGILVAMKVEEDYLDKYIDLVALGTAADIVPLVGENRVFVKEGLDKINFRPEVGIESLIEIASLRPGKIEVGHIIFGLAPRINAVGRLGDALRAVRLLVTRDKSEARKIAQVLEQENRRRKEIDNTTLQEAIAEIEQTFDPQKTRSIVLARNNWHSGVIGIVASRLIDRYYRPTVMISIEDNVGKGSARSIEGFDIFNALRSCGDCLLQFGGHKYAAGLTIDAANIPEFRQRFDAIAREMIPEEDLYPKIRIDAEISLDQITRDLVASLQKFAPFGPSNSRPSFLSRNLEVVAPPRIVGSNHLKLRVQQRGELFDAIGFNLGENIYRVDNGMRTLQMVYVIEESEYMNRKTVQLRIRDLR
ncbi:MAG: single-stranded-DNA-specific exonuclease RecJ [bacterium]